MDAIFKASFFSIIFYFYYIPENDFYNSIYLFLLKISHIYLKRLRKYKKQVNSLGLGLIVLL
ncbi:hypothetical protein B4166_3331 [Caldibacillus thermoamylovorans]|uniref:Secreted protein n=1 Tax=Caldibacillus thermoamylovorans TaxID=35841 RepID=A0ABD4A4Y1_9BACI|nr:hypothetical protein B4166_3331 [Caldibacillus thermoamylovorans]KIO71845.1 hypothetical protein B4167_3314 [Caldibacillus thermoamylovorans]